MLKRAGTLCAALWFFIFLLAVPANLSVADPVQEPRNPTWATPVSLEHSENFFRVTPCIYRSAQPDKKGMKAYEEMGIRSVLNLRGNNNDDDEARGTSLVLLRVPIHTWSIRDEHTIAALTLLRKAEKPVLVHCQHGADRTGLIIAMYRIVEQGWTREAALDELINGGYGYHSVWKNIPEYIRQADVEYIRSHVDARTAGQTQAPCPE